MFDHGGTNHPQEAEEVQAAKEKEPSRPVIPCCCPIYLISHKCCKDCDWICSPRLKCQVAKGELSVDYCLVVG